MRLAAGDGVFMAGIPNEPPIHRPDVARPFRKHYRPSVCARRHFEHVCSHCDVRFLCLEGAQAECIHRANQKLATLVKKMCEHLNGKICDKLAGVSAANVALRS